jgi:hypothetical protein
MVDRIIWSRYKVDMTLVRLGGVGVIVTRYRMEVRGSSPAEEKIFSFLHTRPDRGCVPPSLLYSACHGCFPGAKRPGRGADHPSKSRPKGRLGSAVPVVPLLCRHG